MKKYLLLVPGLVFLLIAAGLSVIATSSSAAEGEEPCVPTEDTTVTQWFETDPGDPWEATNNERVKTAGSDGHYTEWANNGSPVQTATNAPPGAGTDTLRWVAAGTVQVGNGDATEDTVVFDYWQRYSLTGGSFPEGGAVPAFPDPGTPFSWQPNVKGDPHGIGVAGAYSRSAGASGNTDWFYLEAVMKTVPGQDETFHTEYLWQKQLRTFVAGSDAVIEYEYTKSVEGVQCPGEKNPKVVVCKYVGTPGGTFSHIIIVSESTLTHPGIEDAEGNPYVPGDFPFSWTDAHGQTQMGSTAIRYALKGEKAKDVNRVECGDEQEPATCPLDSELNAGEEIPPGETEETFCNIDVAGEETCPTDSELNAGEEIPPGETEATFCNTGGDGPNPPTPAGQQRNVPEVAGKQASPRAVQVPTAVDAGI